MSRAGGMGRNRVIDVVVLSVAVFLGLLALLPVYGGAVAFPAAAGGVLLGAVIVVLARVVGMRPLPVTAVVVVAYLLLGGAFAAPTTVRAGFVPTASTFVGLFEGVVTVWKEILTLTPPLGSADSLLVAPFLFGLVGVVVSGMVATAGVEMQPGVDFPEHTDEVAGTGLSGIGQGASRRRTLIAGLVPVVVAVLAILLGTVDAPFAVLVGISITVLLVPWGAWRLRRLHPRRFLTLGLMFAVALGSGVYLSPLVAGDAGRYVLRNEIVPPFDLRDQVSPLAGYRRFIKDLDDVGLVRVKGLPEDALVRLATMDAFDGVVWNVAADERASGSGAFRRVGQVIPTGARGPEAFVDVRIDDLQGIWLPTVGYARGFEFIGRRSHAQQIAVRYNDATGAAVMPGGVSPGDRYHLQVVVPQIPEDEVLVDDTAADVVLPEPLSVPDSVGTRASEIASSATTAALVARSLERSLADEGWFSHGITSAGDYPSMSGHGASRVNDLLTGPRMVGDSEQYASTMALMARSMGLPARVVMGFIPTAEQLDQDEITFTGADIEAWVEIAFTNHGWVPYFPTPPTSRTPSEEQTEDESKPQPQVIQPPPPPEETVAPPKEDTEKPEVEAPPAEAGGDVDFVALALTTLAIAFPILLLVLPPLLVIAAKKRRRNRRRAAPSTLARVTGAWDELVDAASDHKHHFDVSATRRENARTLEAAIPGANATTVATRADTAVFAPGEPSEAETESVWGEVDQFIGQLDLASTRWQRIRARLSRASLRARRQPASRTPRRNRK